MAKITAVEGIGEKQAAKLIACGVKTQEALLEAGSLPRGRKQVAKDSKISPKLILKWVNRADLARVKGIGGEYADLLECAGVDTVPELARRNPANLTAKMEEVNKKKKLVRTLPSEKKVIGWIDQAKKLPRKINY